MATFKQDHTPVDGPWEPSRQSHEEYVRRTSEKGATTREREANERHRRIAEAAHRRAQLRGFVSGYEEDDWREAEKEIDARETEQHAHTGDCS